MSGLVLRDIHHAYGAAPAVRGASFAVAPGEIVCLYGPSGCGKTTLLRIIAGLERADAGEVLLDGAALAGPGLHTPPERRPIGMVFQEFALFPHLSAIGNVAFGLDAVPHADRMAQAGAMLAAVDMAAFAARYPHQLSGGQQQRVALARALARRPRAMLLDEPFAAIDPPLRRRLRSEMRAALKGRAAAVVFVTHDPEEALDLGDRIVVMAAGAVIEDASAQALWRAPATVEGASIFPGAQIIEAEGRDGGFETAFGLFEAPDARRIAGGARIVVRDGGLTATPDPAGRAAVVDCRFHPRGFSLIATSPDAPGQSLRALSATPAEPGATIALALDWTLAGAFAVR